MSPVGAIFVPFPSKTGTKLLHSSPPPIVERVVKVSVYDKITSIARETNNSGIS